MKNVTISDNIATISTFIAIAGISVSFLSIEIGIIMIFIWGIGMVVATLYA